MEIVP